MKPTNDLAPTHEAAYLRPDLQLITDLIEPDSRVLDVGCGDGALLEMLREKKSVDGRGLELSQVGVNACVARGLSVIQGDADTDLTSYPDQAFDYVILTQTIQATRNPGEVLRELTRIGARVFISFPNFGFWKIRGSLFLKGEMPMTGLLNHSWYDTPNIHLCTLKDFVSLCISLGVTIEQAFGRTNGSPPKPIDPKSAIANLLTEEAIFLLKAINKG